MTIALLRHPPGAGEMALPRPPSAIMFARRIDMQNNLRNFSPVGAFSVGVEKAQVGNGVALVVAGENSGCRGEVVHWGV
jgi:hypothetical protein